MAVGLIFPVHVENIDLRGKVLDQKGKAVKEAEIKLASITCPVYLITPEVSSCLKDVAINPGNIKKSKTL